MKNDKILLPENAPKIDAVYKHYKGDLYTVESLALHSNDDEWMVVYAPMYDDPAASLFVRPLREWDEEIEWEGEKVRRFTLVTAEEESL